MGAAGVEAVGVVGVGVDHQGYAELANEGHEGRGGEHAAAALVGFGVDFGGDAGGGHGADELAGKGAVPGLFLDAGGEMGGVVADFVQVADDVEAAGADHGDGLLVELLDHVADVVAEVAVHLAGEAFGRAVDVDIVAVLVEDEVYAAYAVVEGQGLEIGCVGSPFRAEIVNLHRRQEDGGAVGGPDAVHFGEIGRDVVAAHVARGGEGGRRVGREAVVGESGGHGCSGECVHGVASVAELRVGVQIVESRAV